MRGHCTPEQQAMCPLQTCVGSDIHHLAYEANQYRSPTEKKWRELPENKVRLARCIHNAIHASRYYPEKPSRDEMLNEIQGADTGRAFSERTRQLAIGQALIQAQMEVAS